MYHYGKKVETNGLHAFSCNKTAGSYLLSAYQADSGISRLEFKAKIVPVLHEACLRNAM